MEYSKLQKTISSIIITFFLFGLVFRFPFTNLLSQTEAGNTQLYSIVSILVNEDVYPSVKPKVDRYAEDIQSQLNNTRVVIIPTPSDATAFEIASLNENLFYEGYKGIRTNANFQSQLVGTVLVGKVPIPVVFDGGKAGKTIFPYTDFEDKKYVYNHKTNRYEKNTNNIDGGKSEIWHGVISPNMGNDAANIQGIKDFFDKDHDYYEGVGNFQTSKGIINGKVGDVARDSYEPYVFYFDEFREEAAISYAKYKGYESYLENKEDLNYSRFSKELADKIQKKVLGEEKDQIRDLIKDLDPSIDLDALATGPDISKTSAISTRFITQNVAKKFLEVINSSTLGDFRKDVYNAGRYNGTGSKVNIDTIPYLISVLDAVGDEVLKGVNNHLELKIDRFVEGGFSRDIALPTFIEVEETKEKEEDDYWDGTNIDEVTIKTENENILYGQTSSGITDAYQCSFYRGSTKDGGTLVAANRGFNINHIQPDIDKLLKESKKCANQTMGYWGGNSPLNLDMNQIKDGKFNLKYSKPNKAIEPLFDIVGGKIEKDPKWIPSPMNCMVPNYITIKKETEEEENPGDDNFSFFDVKEGDFTVPVHGRKAQNWTCKTENQIYDYFRTFDDTYKNFYETSSGSIEAKGDILLTFSGSEVSGISLPRIKSKFSGTGTLFVRGKGKVKYDFTETGSLNINNEGFKEIKGKDEREIDFDKMNTFEFIGTGSFDLSDIKGPNTAENFGYKEDDPNQSCNYKVIYLEDELIRGFQGLDGVKTEISIGDLTGDYDGEGGGEDIPHCKPVKKIFYYKKIPSILLHKSPTVEELGTQVKSIMSPDLPIDKDRYVDFISAIGAHVQIKYPYLFRLNVDIGRSGDTDADFDKVTTSLDNFLDQKSAEINQKIRDNNPSSLIGDELEIYNYLKHGPYPKDDFDLKNYLKSKPVKSFTIDGDSKNISYYDTLVFAIFWNNLKSVPQKYKFVFEHYLTDEFSNNKDFALPKHKKFYEVAYLGAPGDAQNMYVTLDPENKGENPYADIVSDNLNINSDLLSSNVFSDNDQEGVFKCAPPEGVPIWKWIPAVVCWLKDMLPPKISISDTKCSSKVLFENRKNNIYDFGQDSYANNSGICSEDNDKNGINDCLEHEIQNGSIETKFSTQRASYGKNVILESTMLDASGSVLTQVSHINTNFELVKVEIPKDKSIEFNETNTEIVYDYTKLNEHSLPEANKYISFKNQTTPLVDGKAKLFFTSKNKDANIYFKSSVQLVDKEGKVVKVLSSKISRLEIRGDVFSSTVYRILEKGEIEYGDFGVTVSDSTNIFLVDELKNPLKDVSKNISNASNAKNKLVFSLSNFSKEGNAVALQYPLKISLEKEGNKIIEPFQVTEAELLLFKGLFGGIKESGEYTLLITDTHGITLERDFTVLSDSPASAEITLGSSTIESSGNITTNLVVLKDQFGNISSGEPYDLSLSIKGGDVVFPDEELGDSSSMTASIFDGYRAFRLKPSGSEGTSILSATVKKAGKTVVSKTALIRTISDIVVDVTLPSKKITVGGDTYKFSITLKDKSGKLLTDFFSRAYLNINPAYGKVDQSYVEVKDGKAEIIFTSSTIAGKDIPVELNIEGLQSIIRKNITIFPGKPMKTDLILSKNKIEASTSELSNLDVELKDRYNNLVFSDNSTALSLELKDEYKNILGIDSLTKTVKNGKATFKLRGTGIPGTAYVKVKTTPDLKNNTFTVGTGSGKIVVKGVGENATKVQSFYFWNKESIIGRNYNSLYSVLLGAEYGDYSQEDYLAGSLLFDRDNRNLAVTSLLNNPYKFDDILTLGKGSGIDVVSAKGDLSQNIDVKIGFDEKNRLYADAYNSALNTYIGKIYYNFGSNTHLKTCLGNGTSIEDCSIPEDGTSITIKSTLSDYSVSQIGGLKLMDDTGKQIVGVDKNGKFSISPFITLDIDTKFSQDQLVLNVKHLDSIIGKIIINFVGHEYKVTRNADTLEAKLANSKNSVYLYLSSYMYGTRDVYSSYGKSKAIYYNDPFGNEKALDRFSSSSLFGLENYINESGLGWKDGNKFLLSFSAGKNVGASVQDYMSFGTINLGDPVISLKKIKKKFNDGKDDKSFDSSIGKLLSRDHDIEDYRVFDYDNDSKDDILLIKSDGYLKLLENKKNSTEFIDKGNLAYVVDVGGHSYVQTGDFSGDGYDDIFFIDGRGDPFLLNNNKKDFVRYPLKDQLKLNGKIVQIRSFDMDNDTIMDLVTLDDAGDINILYGGGTASAPKFSKLSIESGYGIKLNSGARNSNAFIYYDGLLEPGNEIIVTASGTTINESLVDSVIFSQMQYPTSAADEDITASGVLDSIPDLDSGDLGDSGVQTKAVLDSFLNGFGTNINYSGYHNTKNSTSFIRSEYSASAGIEITKTFTDRNGGNLQSSDLIDVEVKVKNISTSTKTGIAYVDSIVKPFVMTDNEPVVSQGKKKVAPSGYDLLVDEMSLKSGEEVSIRYEVKVLPIKFGYIKVGLFEKDEAGDDKYGDIIVKPDNKNCSHDVDIFRSIAARSYDTIGTQSVSCDPEKLKLPDELEDLKIDLDGNGVPDYIDDIVNSGALQQEFGSGALNDMHIDADGDGIPDDEDDSPDFYNEDGDKNFLTVLEDFNRSVDDITDSVDNKIESFGCGFGGGSCIATPLNWAPLAAGQDPTLFGYPIGDGLRVGEGIPIFSAFTGMNIYGSWGCFQVPTFWPSSPLMYTGGACTGSFGAGGSLGVNSPTNFVRLFATPTLTGGFGTAVCYGGPASVAGNSPPQGVSPVVPGGNCIVAAKPLLKCSNDGSEGDPESLGQSDIFGNYGVVNANCAIDQQEGKKSGYSTDKYLNANFVEDYFNYKETGVESSTLKSNYQTALDDIANGKKANNALIDINGGANGDYEFSIELDFAGTREENFKDVVKIQKKRVSGFPSFLMDWVTRQIEEVVTKLTDFPTLFVILPDFGGLVDTNWLEHVSNGLPEAYEQGKETEQARIDRVEDTIDAIKATKNGLDCEGDDEIRCISIDIQAGKLKPQTNQVIEGGNEMISGVRSVYDFLGNIPMVSVKPQQVNIEIPWIDETTWNRTVLNWKLTKKQWEEETIQYSASAGANASVGVDAQKLISSLDQNIQILEGYKEIPTKLSRLLNQKEIWLEQILCNVDAISALTGDRIGQNGKRFKAWVELYIIIKAILKSWQLLVDVFVDYDAECHECKNERDDLLNFQFKLIDMVMPKIPVIRFPKWPDIILDIHNVRAGLTIMMPDFNLTQRPIVLPSLPELNLPRLDAHADASADLNINLPEIPLLPELNIPELPDFPSLPVVELPNLPPPPTIPKLFASLEGILKILKLVTKAMCILKSSPFVPEWRSGDQIAFLTERNGYLPTDFFDLSLPEFSFPFVDAIKVTTWVSLEFETEFMVEMAKQIVDPINSSTSNIVNKFSNAGLNNLDFSSYSQSVDLNIDADASVDLDEGVDLDLDAELDLNSGRINLQDFAKLFAGGVVTVFNHIDEVKDVHVNSKEFITLVNKGLSDIEVTSNPRMDKVLAVWEAVGKQTYAKENKMINDLQANSTEKFDALSNILNNELSKTKKLQENIGKTFVSQRSIFEEIAGEKNQNDFIEYDNTLQKYNKKFLLSARNLVNAGPDEEIKEFKQEGERLLKRIKGGLAYYDQAVTQSTPNGFIQAEGTIGQQNASSAELLTATTPPVPTGVNSCQQANKSVYHYNYKGLYIIEKDKNYRLFDYVDELSGNEEYQTIDFDEDTDDDLLYLVNGELFLKENLQKESTISNISLPILYIDIDDNKFFSEEPYLEAVNGFHEINTDSREMNLVFNAPSDDSVSNFRLEFYSIVDKFLNENISSYIPKNLYKSVVDSFVGIENITITSETDLYTERSHLAYINYVGVVPGIQLKTQELINVQESLKKNKKAVISPNTKLYAGRKSATIKYYIGDEDEVFIETSIKKYSSLEFEEKITIVAITNELYVQSGSEITLSGPDEIKAYIGLPLFFDTNIQSFPDLRSQYSASSHIDITYYDNSDISLNFSEIESYFIYDLGHKSSDYLIRLSKPNNFYYTKLQAFSGDIIGTKSLQKLSSPQLEADVIAPELNFVGTVRIPVYQKKEIDFTTEIYENSGFSSIKKVSVDFNLDVDTDGDGKPTNDEDTNLLKITHTASKISIEFGAYDYLVRKKIGISITDENNNVGYKEVNFEVYAPVPEIEDVEETTKIQGLLDEDLFGEPVNLYRLRGGLVTKLEDISGKEKVKTVDDGVYNFNVSKSSSGLTLTQGALIIAEINELTGKIDVNIPSVVKVEQDEQLYPKLIIENASGTQIYYEYVKLLNNREVVVIDDFDKVEESGVYVKFGNSSSFNFYKVPTGASYSPGVVVVYKKDDAKKEPVFTIFPDGRIKTASELYKLEYSSIGDYIGMKLISRVGDVEIAEILFRIEGSYLMK